MASDLDCLNGISDMLTAALAPYQPSVPPTFVNTSPVAGMIPNTVIGPGRPIQFQATATLEQGDAQVVVYTGKISKPKPYLHNQIYETPAGQTSGAVTNIYEECGRDLQQVIVEIWAYTPEDRDAIGNIVRAAISDVMRLTMPDGTVAIVYWSGSYAHDEEQMDTIWIQRYFFMADITRTLLIGTAQDTGTGYIVTEIDTYVTTQDDQGNTTSSAEVIVPNPTGDPNGT